MVTSTSFVWECTPSGRVIVTVRDVPYESNKLLSTLTSICVILPIKDSSACTMMFSNDTLEMYSPFSAFSRTKLSGILASQ